MDDDLRRRERILNIILVGSIVMLTILDGIVLFYSAKDGPHYKEVSFGIFSLLPLLFVFLYILSRRGHSVLASYLLVTSYFLSNSYAAYRWGVTLQVVILAYALIIIMATILRGTKFGFFITGAIAALIIPLWYGQFHGFIATQRQQLRAIDGFVFATLYMLIMVVAWLYDREIGQSLLRAHISEKALQDERDNLEIIVEERTNELKQTQFEKIEQLNRFAELGQLSSGLFHDIFNILSAISLREEPTTKPSLEQAFNTTKQIDNLTQAIRKQLNHCDLPETFSLIESIEQVIQLLAYKANKEHVRITVASDTNDSIDHFDAPFKFHQIMLNLLLNAIEAFEVLPENDERERNVLVTIQKHAGEINVRVEDNGCGIPTEILPRIFDKFLTTKEASKGIGIGLATIKKIIQEDLGGAITAHSSVNKGSTFIVTFPLKHAPLSKNNKPSP